MKTTPAAEDGSRSGSIAPGSRRRKAITALVGVVGLALLIVHMNRYPVTDLASIGGSNLAAPSAGKLVAMLRSLACWGLINLSALGLGERFERRLPLSPALARYRFLYQLGIGFSLLGLGILLLASLHLLQDAGIAALLVAPVLWYAAASRDRIRRQLCGLRSAWPDRAVVWCYVACAILLANAYLRVFDHDFGWDALTYHLAFPERYLFENGIAMTPFSHLSGYIAGTEMLYVLALFLDGPNLAVLIHFEFGVLTLVALWTLGRASSSRAAILAPLFLIADPLFQRELGWAYSDLSFSFYFTLSAIAFCTWSESRSASEPDARDLTYAGIACGLCCATRYLGANVAFALCLLVWLPPRRDRMRANLRASLTIASLSLGILLPWMLRNALFTGNPVTPLLQSLFYTRGEEYIPAIVMQQATEFLRHVGMGRDPWALLALPWNLTMNTLPGSYSNSFGYQISALHLVALVTVAGLAGSGRRLRDVPLLVPMLRLIGVFVVMWFITFQEVRFLLPIFPLIAFAGAVALDRSIDRSMRWSPALVALPVIAVLYTQVAMFVELPAAYASALTRGSSEDGAERGANAAAGFVREKMGAGDKLMLWMEPRAYLFRGVDYVPYHIESGSPTLALVHQFHDDRALHCGLQALGITHLLVNRNFARKVQPGLFVAGYQQEDFASDRIRVNQLLSRGARLLYSEDGTEFYRLETRTCIRD